MLADSVAAVSAGIVGGERLLDLCYEEDAKAEVDLNVVMTSDGRLVEVQGTAEGEPFGARRPRRAAGRSPRRGSPSSPRSSAGLSKPSPSGTPGSGAPTRGRTFPDRLVIASRNAGKIREIRRICADWPVELLTSEDVDWPDVEETEDTYLGNASLKARAVAEATGIPALADDSGIEVDALGGEPGPRSARYAGEGATDDENLSRAAGGARRRAGRRAHGPVSRGGRGRVAGRARSVWAEATCEGTLTKKPRGEGGFGYDPAFVPEGWDRTMAELTPEEKDRISHRGRSLRALANGLS